MNQRLRLVLSASACLAMGASASLAGAFINFGSGVTPSDASGDGSVICGSHDTTGSLFHFSEFTGIIDVGGGTAGNGVGNQQDISNDGTRFTGSALNTDSGLFEAAVYDIPAAKWTPLGGLDGSSGPERSGAWGISGDGRTVVGLGWVASGRAHAIQSVDGAPVTDLGSTVLNRSSRANSVSYDGSVVVGWQDGAGRQGAMWKNGTQTLLTLAANGAVLGEAQCVSADGKWVAGTGIRASGNQAYRWSEATSGENLGTLGLGLSGAATAISDDGNSIIGYNRSLGPAVGGEGFIWTPSMGMVNLTTYVTGLGIDTQGVNLALPLGMSADGQTIVGMGRKGGSSVGFAVNLRAVPEPGSLALLGSGLFALPLMRRRKA